MATPGESVARQLAADVVANKNRNLKPSSPTANVQITNADHIAANKVFDDWKTSMKLRANDQKNKVEGYFGKDFISEFDHKKGEELVAKFNKIEGYSALTPGGRKAFANKMRECFVSLGFLSEKPTPSKSLPVTPPGAAKPPAPNKPAPKGAGASGRTLRVQVATPPRQAKPPAAAPKPPPPKESDGKGNRLDSSLQRSRARGLPRRGMQPQPTTTTGSATSGDGNAAELARLRGELDEARAKNQELEKRVAAKDGEIKEKAEEARKDVIAQANKTINEYKSQKVMLQNLLNKATQQKEDLVKQKEDLVKQIDTLKGTQALLIDSSKNLTKKLEKSRRGDEGFALAYELVCVELDMRILDKQSKAVKGDMASVLNISKNQLKEEHAKYVKKLFKYIDNLNASIVYRFVSIVNILMNAHEEFISSDYNLLRGELKNIYDKVQKDSKKIRDFSQSAHNDVSALTSIEDEYKLSKYAGSKNEQSVTELKKWVEGFIHDVNYGDTSENTLARIWCLAKEQEQKNNWVYFGYSSKEEFHRLFRDCFRRDSNQGKPNVGLLYAKLLDKCFSTKVSERVDACREKLEEWEKCQEALEEVERLRQKLGEGEARLKESRKEAENIKQQGKQAETFKEIAQQAYDRTAKAERELRSKDSALSQIKRVLQSGRATDQQKISAALRLV